MKTELIKDTLKCGVILYGDHIDFDFDPHTSTHDFAMLTKAVFEHEKIKRGYCIEITGEHGGMAGTILYGLYGDLDSYGHRIVIEEYNLTDFLIRALVVLEGG